MKKNTNLNQIKKEEIKKEVIKKEENKKEENKKEEGGRWVLNCFNHWEWISDDDNTPHLNAFNHWE